MPSPALAKFEERMREVERLLSLCSIDSIESGTREENLERDGSILRGALVLLCSHLEGFFEDLVSDFISAYNWLAKSIEQLPAELRATQVMGSPSKWDQKDPSKRWETVTSWAAHPLLQSDLILPLNCMDADIHVVGFSNPGTLEIEKLFKSIGILNVWDLFIKHEPDKVVKMSIDGIVNRRNQIAHGKLDASITLVDAGIYLDRTRKVASVFNTIVSEVLNVRLGIADCWQALEDTNSVTS